MYFPHADLLGNCIYVSSVALLWWACSRRMKRKIFIGGLLGLHSMMIVFLFSMYMRWSDDLGWAFYFPAELVGLSIGIVLSIVIKTANQPLEPTAPSGRGPA